MRLIIIPKCTPRRECCAASASACLCCARATRGISKPVSASVFIRISHTAHAARCRTHECCTTSVIITACNNILSFDDAGAIIIITQVCAACASDKTCSALMRRVSTRRLGRLKKHSARALDADSSESIELLARFEVGHENRNATPGAFVRRRLSTSVFGALASPPQRAHFPIKSIPHTN